MVEIPELAEDRQNWKIYCVKLLEVAATRGWLCVLAGEPFDGMYDWQGYDTLLHKIFNYTVPINIYVQLHCNTAHQVFKYLAKQFSNNEPIPYANKLQCTGTAAAAETPENYPMSVNAATEWHANANSDEDLSNSTKALTQGTQDIDNRNRGAQSCRCRFCFCCGSRERSRKVLSIAVNLGLCNQFHRTSALQDH